MATRAIFITKKEDKYIGAWLWFDGNGLTRLLNNKFGTKELAEELISKEQLCGICNEREKKINEDWYKSFCENNSEEYENYFIRRPYEKMSNGLYVQLYRDYEARHNGEKSDIPLTFDSIEEAAGQDINVLYVFDTDKNKWIRHS